jgi:hypothetical protein
MTTATPAISARIPDSVKRGYHTSASAHEPATRINGRSGFHNLAIQMPGGMSEHRQDDCEADKKGQGAD